MPVDPFLQPLLLQLPPLPTITDFPAWRREGEAAANAMVDQLTAPGPAIRERRQISIPVQAGEIEVVLHYPDLEGPLPLHVYLHGGGWIGGSAQDSYIDILGAERAAGATCVVAAVDYRKAPEHRFPTGLDDCYAALNWLVDHADDLGLRADAVTVGGGSAGANLAAALTLKVRDEGGPKIAFQLLEVPALDFTRSSPSHGTYGSGYGLTTVDLDQIFELYLSAPDDATKPYASPLLAADLSGLPPAHIMSAEFDPLRDDGPRYAARLNEAGVPATFTLGLSHIHVSPAFTKAMPAAVQWRDEALAQLSAAHGALAVQNRD